MKGQLLLPLGDIIYPFDPEECELVRGALLRLDDESRLRGYSVVEGKRVRLDVCPAATD